LPGLRREQVVRGPGTRALSADLTTVTCAGQWRPLGFSLDAISGLTFRVDTLSAQEIKARKPWVEPMATRVGAQAVVTDDANGFQHGGR